MFRQILALLLAGFAAMSGEAAERERIRATWVEFRDQVAARGLSGRSARVALAGGKTVSTAVLRVEPDALTVRETRAVKSWRSAVEGEASIPKGQIVSVRFTGKTGNRRLIGALAGLGAGAGIGAAVATSSDINEGPGIIVIPILGAGIAILGAVGGYLVGKSLDQPRPEFVLTP